MLVLITGGGEREMMRMVRKWWRSFDMTPTWNFIRHIMEEEVRMEKMQMMRMGLWTRKMEGRGGGK